jgi:hypothetical protein
MNRNLTTQNLPTDDHGCVEVETLPRETVSRVIDIYDDLRSKCYALARKNDGELMGEDAWLRNAMSDTDITLEWRNDGMHCRGLAYTSQTWDHEPFAFTIPWERILD